ncbi:MAG: TetR/AcrR family transcriptional regulator [Actinomycetia bacterium]|nr:TetR/AcrR family transcriptional regulator [Actinomycetes bacterium]
MSTGAVVPPLTRARRKQLTRDHLLAAAEALFVERGFHGASIDDIAEAAGFTKGAVYAHFKNKEELFIALTERRWDAQLARVRDALETSAPSATAETSETFIELTRSLLWGAPEWQLLLLEFNVYAARNPSARRRLSERSRIGRSTLATLLQQDLDRRGVDIGLSADALAGVLLAFFNGIALKHVTNAGDDDDEVLVSAIALIDRALDRAPNSGRRAARGSGRKSSPEARG